MPGISTPRPLQSLTRLREAFDIEAFHDRMPENRALSPRPLRAHPESSLDRD